MKRPFLLAIALLCGAAPLHAGDDGASEATRTLATGNWGGARSTRKDAGIDLQGGYIVDLQGNPTGGRERATAYAGLLQLDVSFDMGTLLGPAQPTARSSPICSSRM